MKFPFYTQKNWLPDGAKFVPMLLPFWGKQLEDNASPDKGRFDQLQKRGANYLKMVQSPEDARAILLPFEYRFEEACSSVYNTVQELSVKHNIPVIVFYNNDDDTPINFAGSIVFRTSYLRSAAGTNVYAYPAWSNDFTKYFANGKYTALQKEPKPSVGYCGYIDYAKERGYIFSLIRSTLDKSFIKEPIREGSKLRGLAVRRLSASKSIRANFIIRNGFWAEGESDKLKARLDYASTMINSAYTIVVRGGGNFSYRLYEVMSCGRIPLFIDTDSPLPFDAFINWKEAMVYLPYQQINKVESVMLKYHNSISSQDFIRTQENNRCLYEEWLSPLGFHKNLYRYF